MITMSNRDPLYFAYGSNMKVERLRERIGDFPKLSVGRLPETRLRFNKLSRDGSAKANISHDPDCEVWGVVFVVTNEQFALLDKLEAGYERRPVKVYLNDGSMIQAETYSSVKTDERTLPFESYKRLVVDGAIENRLPSAYVRYLASCPAKSDEAYTSNVA
jgi:gamma-glutamylcyclotransferase